MTRAEHVQWAKERALNEPTTQGMPVAQWLMFKHDMFKHDEIRDDDTIAFLFGIGDDVVKHVMFPSGFPLDLNPFVNQILSVGPLNVRSFIEGFQ